MRYRPTRPPARAMMPGRWRRWTANVRIWNQEFGIWNAFQNCGVAYAFQIPNSKSLLSKLAVHETGVERAAYDADAVTTLHQITVEANPCDEILQHLQSVAPVISAHRVPERRSGHEGRAACARLFVLGPIRGDAVRPTRTRPFVARDLWRLGELRGQAGASRGGGPATLDARVRQCAPALVALSNRVLSGLGP